MIENERRNVLQRQRFFTTFDEFSPDNRVSQVLKAALARCREQRMDATVARLADGLWLDFDTVTCVRDPGPWYKSVYADRTLARFQESLALAKMILDLQGPDRDQAGRSCFALMFDMNECLSDLSQRKLGRPYAVQDWP